MTKIDTNLFSMQVSVPHSVYGHCEYFMPKPLRAWIVAHGLDNTFVGGSCTGNGYTDGVTNRESTYMVYNIDKTDALSFKIMFPKCRVHISEQYEYA